MKALATVLILTTSLILALGVSAAFAYFAAAGTATTGTASSSTGQTVTITPGVPTGSLDPGGSAAVSLVLGNSSGSVAHVDSLQLDSSQGASGFAVDSGHDGCTTSSVTFTGSSAGWDVPANGSIAVTLPGSLSLSSNAPNACQGATFTVYLKAA